MDSKDFRLLVALHEDARQSYRSLGRRVSLSAPAVRERLNRLRELGVLPGCWCYPDPSIFGRDDLMFFFSGDWKREDALRVLKVPDVAFVAWKLDGSLSVQAWPKNREDPAKGLSEILGSGPSGQTFTEPTHHGNLSAADWRIIDVLIDDPTIPLRDLTTKTGLTSKTVRKHLSSLIRDKALFLMPRLGSLADSGEVVYHLAVIGGVAWSELQEVLGDAYLVSQTSEPPMRYVLRRASNLADATSKTQAVGKLSGVSSVTVTLNRELFLGIGYIHSLVHEKMREWEQARLTLARG